MQTETSEPKFLHVPKLLDTAETAAVLKKKPGTLVVWRARKSHPELKYMKLGANVVYDERDVVAFIELQRSKGSEDVTRRRSRKRSLKRERSDGEPKR